MAMVGGLIGLVGALAIFVGAIMVLIKAFQKSIVWGIASLFIPVVLFVFAILNWSESKRGILILLAGVAATILGTALGALSGEPVEMPQV